ncbi:MAG: DUF1223 domain-containing protein [Bdellovibrionales bacterium]|nr:DUF1223 domain-containing protein [Bdellovibrionales bacterium]
MAPVRTSAPAGIRKWNKLKRLNRLFSAAAAALCGLLLPAAQPSAAQDSNAARPFVVLELFTSQGCSSCPPADKLLREVAEKARREKSRIYPLSFHIDYWNYIGWTDPYSGANASARQRAYAAAMNESGVYTPQLVVNGAQHFPGTRARQLQAAITSSLSHTPKADVSLSGVEKVSAKELKVRYSYSGAAKNSLLRLALVNSPDPNYVSRGENAGSTLSHTNVVRVFKTVELVQGSGSGEVSLELPDGFTHSNAQIISLVQNKANMHIDGASSIDLSEVL